MTIKSTAGKMLLYLYKMQRSTPIDMPKRQLVFVDKPGKGVAMTSDKVWLAKDLLEINGSGADVYNAFRFLLDKEYVKSNLRLSPQAMVYTGLELTAMGIDIVEGVERDSGGATAFSEAFNMSVEAGTKVDKVVEQQLSSLD